MLEGEQGISVKYCLWKLLTIPNTQEAQPEQNVFREMSKSPRIPQQVINDLSFDLVSVHFRPSQVLTLHTIYLWLKGASKYLTLNFTPIQPLLCGNIFLGFPLTFNQVKFTFLLSLWIHRNWKAFLNCPCQGILAFWRTMVAFCFTFWPCFRHNICLISAGLKCN